MAYYGLHLLEIHQLVVHVGGGKEHVGRDMAVFQTIGKGAHQRKKTEQKCLQDKQCSAFSDWIHRFPSMCAAVRHRHMDLPQLASVEHHVCSLVNIIKETLFFVHFYFMWAFLGRSLAGPGPLLRLLPDAAPPLGQRTMPLGPTALTFLCRSDSITANWRYA